VLFDTVIRNRKEEDRFLFPLDVPEGDEVEIIPDMDENLDTGETSYTRSQEPKLDKAPTSPRKGRPPISTELQEKASRILVLATAELLLFMVLFVLLSMLAKLAAPHLILPNWKLAIVCLCYYAFVTISSLYFSGKTTASILAASIVR